MICEDVNLIELADSRIQCWADVLLVTNLVVLLSLCFGFRVSSLVGMILTV
jgi:hypothetical protein